MSDQRLRRALFAGAAAGVLFAGPALAQQEQCAQRLDQIEQQLSQADLESQRQEDLNQVIEGARLLADTGDQQGCMNVVAELDDLMTTLEEADRLETAQGGQQEQAGGAQGQAGDQGQAVQQTERSIQQGEHALEQDDVEGAQQALDEASSSIQQAKEQASEQARQQLEQAEQQIANARQAIGEDDVEGARQALQDAEQPIQQAMAQQDQAGRQTSQAGQQAAATDQERQQEQAAATGQGQQQEQAQVTEENPLAAMPASDVIGSEVKNQEGDTVAEIVDIVKRQGQDDLYAVLSVGGFLGIGDKEVMVPVNKLQVSQEGEIVMVNVSEEQLRQMPPYEEEGFESTAQLEQPPAQQ